MLVSRLVYCVTSQEDKALSAVSRLVYCVTNQEDKGLTACK